MATFEIIEKEVNNARDRLNKAEEKLEEFEKRWKEKKLWELGKKLEHREEKNEEQRQVWKRQRDIMQLLKFGEEKASRCLFYTVILMHPIFGQFVDDCKDGRPASEDFLFILKLSYYMSMFYNSERERAENRYTTYGSLIAGKYYYANVEAKVKLGSGGEPLFLTTIYYLNMVRENAMKYPGIYGFSGSTCPKKVHMDPLTPMFPLAWNPYEKDLGDTTVYFKYVLQPIKEKLIFFAKNDMDKNICIKFVHQYSADAHNHCTNKAYAPHLHSCEHIPGGWLMIIIDLNAYFTYDPCSRSFPSVDEVKSKINDIVKHLHECDWVHGDLRSVNFLVRINGNNNLPLVMLTSLVCAGQMKLRVES
ncbi:9033_t:CDS:2 [Funneliformis caledonium]|uniref:9033_t:CDS:1 n=1 Tax=Funneliformis caledonium TaxID=1117310 RepID=A0A9N9CKJ9_9GLOM|nr:9033_t:CDS:2 [Funneliformis caledonium]